MHSKLQGLAKPNRLSMPRPAGECPRAISGEPHAGCIAWRDGEKLTSRGPQGIRGEPEVNGRQRVAADSTTCRLREATSEKARENGRNSTKRETTYQRVQEADQAGGALEKESPIAKRCPRQRWPGRVVDGDDRETATTSNERQGASAQGQL